jgi:hypothetical protein
MRERISAMPLLSRSGSSPLSRDEESLPSKDSQCSDAERRSLGEMSLYAHRGTSGPRVRAELQPLRPARANVLVRVQELRLPPPASACRISSSTMGGKLYKHVDRARYTWICMNPTKPPPAM